MNTRIIHTGLYSNDTMKILTAVFEDIHAAYSNKRRTKRTRSVLRTHVVQADDNEVVFSIESFSRYSIQSPFPGWSDVRVLDHLGWEMKQIVMRKANEACESMKNVWKRNSSAHYVFDEDGTDRFDAAIPQVYFIYDTFRGRRTDDKYLKEFADSLISMPLDPIMTEMKIAQKEEIKKIDKERNLKLRELRNKIYYNAEKARKAAYAAGDREIAQLNNEYDKKIESLKNEMDNYSAAALLMN